MAQSYRYGPSQWQTWCAMCDRVLQKGDLVHFGGGGLKLHERCHEKEAGNEALKGFHFHGFPATWDGKCASCDRKIEKGELIRWSSATVCTQCMPAPEETF